MEIILASSSPRRQELLKRVVKDFEVIPAEIDETYHEELMMPTEYVQEMAQRKTQLIYKEHPDALVIGCDTAVIHHHDILGKPKNEEEAFQMLKRLSGDRHSVCTSVVLIGKNRVMQKTVTTDVEFFALSDEEIRDYLATGDYIGKAGAYGIQDGAALFVKKIKGDFYSVMGLPIGYVNQMLKTYD